MLGRGFEELGEFKVIGFFCICNASLSDRQTSRNACIYCTRYGINSHKRCLHGIAVPPGMAHSLRGEMQTKQC